MFNVSIQDILNLLLQFGQLAGLAALIAALVNVFKTFGLVKDGDAGRWSAALNLVGITALVGLRIFAPAVTLEVVDANAAALANILLIVLGYVVQIGVSQKTHFTLSAAKVPLIGKSFWEATHVALTAEIEAEASE